MPAGYKAISIIGYSTGNWWWDISSYYFNLNFDTGNVWCRVGNLDGQNGGSGTVSFTVLCMYVGE